MNSNPIQVLEYDPRWPLEFNQLQKVISYTLGELAEGIEHVGSTAVPD